MVGSAADLSDGLALEWLADLEWFVILRDRRSMTKLHSGNTMMM